MGMTGRTVFAGLLAFAGTVFGPATISFTSTASAQDGVAEPAATVSEAPPPIIPTSAFAGGNALRQAALSPDGQRIAAIIDVAGVAHVVLLDPATLKPINKFGVDDKNDIEWFQWAGNDKILVSISSTGTFEGDEALYTRLIVVNLKTVKASLLEPRGEKGRQSVVDGDDLVFLDEAGTYALVSMQDTVYNYPSVFKFDLEQGRPVATVQSPRDGVWNWYADDAGVIRVGTGWFQNRLRVFYREQADAELRIIGRMKEDEVEQGFWAVASIVSGSDQGYVLRENGEGRVGLHLFDYAKQEIVETVYENPEWDVDEVTFRDGKPFAAYFTDDRDRVVWFDDDRKRWQESLDKAMAEEQSWITSIAKDNSRMLVWGGGESDPGAMYVFTPAQKALTQLVEMRPKVDFRQLARPKPVSYTARDGVEIRAYLTLPRGREAKGLPLILLPHGGPYGVRDKLRYDDEVQLLANRGYAVLQPNFRGSAGYGESFSELGRGQIGRKMQDDLDDATDWAIAQGIADKDRVCVVGGSYGGYAALWAAIRNPERYRCAASWAGVTDFDAQLKYDKNFFTRNGGRRWRERVEGEAEFDLDSISPAANAARLTRPILLAHGKDDNNVPFSQFKKMRSALEKTSADVDYLVIEDEGHSFSKPENEQAWYDALVGFLAEHNPAD